MKWNEICIKELFLSLRLLEMQILFSRKHKQNWAYKTMNKLEIPRASWTQQRTDIKNKILRETLRAINTIAQ